MAATKGKADKKPATKKTGAKPRKREPAITMQDALQIAQAYLADKGAFSVSGIVDGIPRGIRGVLRRQTNSLPTALNDCWIVECSLDPFLVVDGGTMLIGISKTTGDILYAGILNVA